MWEAYQYWKKIAEKLRQENPPRSVIPYPPNFREFDPLSLLQNESIFNSLILCYQKVFGSRDIWGEGAKCASCGDQIPIEEFVERKARHDFACSQCQGKYQQIFPVDFLKKRIALELNPAIYKHPFIILYLNDEGAEVVGFCWGVVETPARIVERIVQNKYADQPEIAQLVRDKIMASFSPDELIVYYDEIGILKEFRGGIGPVVSLVRLGLETGSKNNSCKVLYWTSRKSPIYMFCRLTGFEDLFETPDGLIYCYSEDFSPSLIATQYLLPEEQSKIVAEVARDILK
jgi:hypothetical protein